ncbi:unnamed protein product [Alopecurus aequalis]
MAGDGDGDGRRIVFFPYPLPGHDTPMLLLAGALHARGFAVTVFHTELRAPDPADYPADYRFVPLHAEVPQEVVASDGIMRLSTGLNDSSEAPFKDRLVAALAAGMAMNDSSEAPLKDRPVAALAAEGTAMKQSSEAPFKDRLVAALAAEGTAMNDSSEAWLEDRLATGLSAEGMALNDSSEAPFKDRLAAALAAEGAGVRCVITDVVWYRAQAVAKSLGVPVLGFMTDSAANFWIYMRFNNLIDEGYLSGQAARKHSVMDLLVRLIVAGARQSSGLIFDTLGEAADLGKIRDGLSVPVFAVGPLHKVVPPPANASSSSLYDWNSTVEAMSEGVELAAATVIKKMVADKEIREGMDGLRLAVEEAIINAQTDLIALVDLIKSF